MNIHPNYKPNFNLIRKSRLEISFILGLSFVAFWLTHSALTLQLAIIQVLGLFAFCLNLISFSRSNKQSIIKWQIASSTFLAVHYFWLGVFWVAVASLLVILRNFLVVSKLNWLWYLPFLNLGIVAILPFTQNWVDQISLVSIGLLAIIMVFGDDKSVRLGYLMSAAIWIFIAFYSDSLGGFLNSLFNLIIMGISTYHYDVKGNQTKTTKA